MITARISRAVSGSEAPIGYEAKDTRTSLLMGVGHLVIYSGWKLVMAAAYAAGNFSESLGVAPATDGNTLLVVPDGISRHGFKKCAKGSNPRR